MDIQIRSTPEVAVLTIQGNINNETLHRLSRQLEEAIGRGCKHVVLDLAETRILLSSGISFFIDAHDMSEQAGGKLHLANVTREITHILKVARVDDFLGEQKNLQEVLGELGIGEADLQEGLPNRDRHSTGLYSPVLEPEAKEETPDAEAEADAPSEMETIREAPKRKSGVILKPASLKLAKDTPADKAKAEAAAGGETLPDDRMQKLIQRYMPGRLMVDILDHFVTGQHSSASADDVAKALEQKPKDVQRKMKDLEQRGVLKPLGGDLYNYAPPEGVARDLDAFFRAWRRAQDHSRLVMMVLAAET
ncbi:MAG: STAS domain-containing protein [Planctomycetota bacterium]